MKGIRNVTALMAEAQEQEKAGQLKPAATLYQRMVDADPRNSEAVTRLLIVYRRLKDYPGELKVINAALAAIADRGKAAQQSWVSSHPEAAKIGKAILRTLGGEEISGYGTDPIVERLQRRKALVDKKIGGGKIKRVKIGQLKKPAKKVAISVKRDSSREKRQEDKAAKATARREETEKKKAALAERLAAAEAKKKAANEKKRAERERKQQEVARIAAEKKPARQAEAKIKTQPSLFVITLRYLANLEQIDAAMGRHVAFLNKYFANGTFLVSGRQVPRTGGVIIARVKSRSTLEKIIKQDPFVKGRLASFDIVEFKATKTGRAFAGLGFING
jgi:uncharacterized protein YciI